MPGSIVRRPGVVSALTYTPLALAAAGAFLVATAFTGDYSLVTRVGGAAWVFLLAMIILMPTITPLVKRRLNEPRQAPSHAPEGSNDMSFLESLFKRGKTFNDPVCGMEIDPGRTQWTSTYDGAAFSFCSKRCKEAFDADPAQYVAGAHGEVTHRSHT